MASGFGRQGEVVFPTDETDITAAAGTEQGATSPVDDPSTLSAPPREQAHKDLAMFWSGGKDCATALYKISSMERYRTHLRVSSLLTTLTRDYDRISGHGVHSTILDRQAACLGLKLRKTYITRTSTIGDYEQMIEDALREERNVGTKVVSSGDIFFDKRRRATVRDVGLQGCFPLYGRDTADHVREIINLGLKAWVVCVNSAVLDRSFVGCQVDRDFLTRLPASVDPCGEYGEYHTFVVDGPMFREPVRCRRGQIVLREGFYFCDLTVD
jgi:uncharacterized protein (TIGR00290 family)